MPRSLSTICHASKSTARAAKCSSYIWISDDLLEHTFSAFVKTHKRHGSNVPGPLEARRRASKRASTTLAQTPYSYHPDPAVVMSSVAQANWWMPVKPATELDILTEKKSGKRPSWPGLPTMPHRPPPVPVPLQTPATIETTSTSSVNLEGFYQKLKQLETFEQLGQELKLRSITSIPHHDGLSTRILTMMFYRNWDVSEIEKFLLDPKMNPAGSLNFRYLFGTLFRKTHTEDVPARSLAQKLVNGNVVEKAAHLGLLCDKDVIEIFSFAVKQDASFFEQGENSTTFIEALFHAMQHSRVARVSDLGGKALCEDMLSALRKVIGYTISSTQVPTTAPAAFEGPTNSTFYASTPRLIWRLYSHMSKTKQPKSKVLSDTIIECLRSIDQWTVQRLRYLVDFILTLQPTLINAAIYNVTLHLESCETQRKEDSTSAEPHNLAENAELDALLRRALLAQTGELQKPDKEPWKAKLDGREHSAIVAEIMRAKAVDHLPSENDVSIPISRKPEILELWYAVLGAIGSDPKSRFVLHKPYLTAFIHRDNPTIDIRKRIVFGFWVAMALSVRVNRSIAVLDNAGYGGEILQRFRKEGCAVGEDFVGSLIVSLHDSPLPAKNKLLHRICTIGRIPQIRENYQELSRLYGALKNKELSVFDSKRDYLKIRRHFPERLRATCESFNVDLASFEKTARTIIRETKGSAKLVLRLLKHNIMLKQSLRTAAGLMSWDGSEFKANESADAKALGDYSYNDLVRMINNLAWDCAHSEMLSDRHAFRYAWWLLMYLHMHRAPVLPTMLKAVWHAAIIRNPRLNYGAIQALHSINEEYLGEAAARDLLKSDRSSIVDLSACNPAEDGESAAEAVLKSWRSQSSQVAEDADRRHEGAGVFEPFGSRED